MHGRTCPEDPRLTFVESNFRFMHTWLRYYGIERVDGILAVWAFRRTISIRRARFFVSLRCAARHADEPGARLTAADVVNGYDHVRLTALLRDYGELDSPHRITQCIERSRAERPLAMIDELIAAVAPVTPRGGESKFLAKLFQALRIEVNGEMEALKMMLEQTVRSLAPGGRLAVITYHSLEDRLVKNFMRSGNFGGKVEKDFYGRVQTPFEVVTRKAVVPTPEEIERNPRSRSAKLRIAELSGPLRQES